MDYKDTTPKIAKDVFLAPGSHIIGDVEIGEGSSIWFNTVLRGDVNFIRVGRNTNIQDLSVVHVATNSFPTIIGDGVTIGHKALVHACTIGNRCLIGMGSIIMDGAVIGDDCVVAAGALVTQGTKVPSGSLVIGSPAQVKRPIKDKEREWIAWSAKHYREIAGCYNL